MVNQLARADPDAAARMAALAAELRAAERAKDGPRLRELSAARGSLIDALTAQALAAAGTPDPPPSLRAEVTDTLTAALADPETAAAFAAGTLTKAAQWSGFGYADSRPGRRRGARRRPLLPPPLDPAPVDIATRRSRRARTAANSGRRRRGIASRRARRARARPATRPRRPGRPLPRQADRGEARSDRREPVRCRSPRSARAREQRQRHGQREQQRQAEEEQRRAQEAAERAARAREKFEDAERTLAQASAAAAEAAAVEDRLEAEVRQLEERLTQAREELAAARLRARRAEGGRAPRPAGPGPAPVTTFVRSADGRQLAVKFSGNPAGHPVFFLHGTPGSRVGPLPRGRVLYELGVRLISFDRPGYGGSDRLESRLVADVVPDVWRSRTHSEIDRFAVLGRSGGGPHALACAALLPDRVTRAGRAGVAGAVGGRGARLVRRHGRVQRARVHGRGRDPSC